MTAHKSQGQTLDEVLIDFSGEARINNGSFYTAISRVKLGICSSLMLESESSACKHEYMVFRCSFHACNKLTDLFQIFHILQVCLFRLS